VNEHEGKPRSQIGSQLDGKTDSTSILDRGRIYDKAGTLVCNVLLYKIRGERYSLLHAQQLTLATKKFRSRTRRASEMFRSAE